MALTESAPPGTLGMDRDTLIAMYRHMVLGRVLDERVIVLNRQGMAPFAVSGQGHEATQVGAGYALRAGHDWVVPYYRDATLSLVLGMRPVDHLFAALGRAADPSSGGRQMPGHFSSRECRIVTTGSAVATQVLHAVGIALAVRSRREDLVVLTTCGEGGTSEGDFHEALNWAGIHRLPVIFLVENNHFAISVPQSRQMAVQRVAERAVGYGMPGVTVDGGDVLAVHGAMAEAVARARRGEGPTLLEALCVRLQSHSSDDDQRRYRDPADLLDLRQHDPLDRFRADLEAAQVLDPQAAEAIRRACRDEVDEAQAEAEAALAPDPATAADHVYGTAP
ncbi:MAG TPA: thiamine pyrophosphate-dependent dehydrogenase E1 component subunit alpha [Candidatus Dormibacteraeota bacterium]|nr:thiamine pyrophosphate-dependent dehydrogenase E1 component subunit alpha [Candidatus Dormibacteraeota bacterium]